MINRIALLSDLQKLLQRLESDLLERSESVEVPEVGKTLRAEYDRAKTAERTAQNYEDWRTDAITQAAAAWVLSCVFVRFLEDNLLIDPPKIAGPDDRLDRARDEHELYFREHPKLTDRDYLLSLFDDLAKLPGTKDLFGEHNPIRELPNWLSGDAAEELLKFFQKIDANSGLLVHDFTDSNWDTRFLGDLYQDLSEAARKKYALLQTPEFVEEFILERTLEPALDEFGLVVTTSASDSQPFKMIDPACGSGHFLLGSFRRILDRWQFREPRTNVRELVQRTLDSVHGVDVNPFAIAIARFRLLLAAIRAVGIERLADAPAFRLSLVCGDSLLHAPLAAGGKKYTSGQQELDFALASDPADSDECDHAYRSENLPELKRLLRRGQYHAVVGNPPYITVKDRAVSELYRARFPSCHRAYSLSVPFMERFFDLAVKGDGTPQQPAGFVGQITSNSFMKREFGKKLIAEYLPRWDLTHVLDTAGAYIPGHGTPTVILFGKHQPPVSGTIRTVLGITGEPATPANPAQGLVWQAIVQQIDQPGSVNEWVSVADSRRANFHKHPWSIGGGGAAELKQRLDDEVDIPLTDMIFDVGARLLTRLDEVFELPFGCAKRIGALTGEVRPFVVGEDVRHWGICPQNELLFPYSATLEPNCSPAAALYLWNWRSLLERRVAFGKSQTERGLPWFGFSMIFRKRLLMEPALIFSDVATHNHFAVEGNGVPANSHAPIIILKPEFADKIVCLAGLLNSSCACFWMKQVFHNKGSTVDSHGARQRTAAFEDFYEHDGTKLSSFPISAHQPTQLPTALIQTSTALQAQSPAATLASWSGAESGDLRTRLVAARDQAKRLRRLLIAWQEEMDWQIYEAFGLVEGAEASGPAAVSLPEGAAVDAIPPEGIELGQRAFEIVLARRMAAGEAQSTWFERHGSTPITEVPRHWPAPYRELVERRVRRIADDPAIRLIEQPEYKRRWNTAPWDEQLERALRQRLLDRLESYFDFDGRMQECGQQSAVSGKPEEKKAESRSLIAESSLVSVAKLADVARQDADFQQVGELYRDDPAFDVQALVTELVAVECVPLLPMLRYKPSGLIKRRTWERTWDLQRQEDAIDARTKLPSTDPQHLSSDAASNLKQKQVGNIPVPTKYDSKDFLDSNLWRLRGKLDVPKERWISFPHCEGPDGTPVIAWAGYDHLQQARAISAYYVRVQTEFGGTDDPRLFPLLACLIELLPWLKQWHNEPDANFDGMRMGDYFEGFVNEEARQLNKTIPEIQAWIPPKKVAKGQRGKGAKKGKEEEGEE